VSQTVTILGAGVMGSAIVLPFADRGMAVRLVGTHLDRAIIDSVKATGLHPRLNVTLPKGIAAFHHEEFGKALRDDSDFILLGIASAGVGWAIDRLCENLTRSVPVVMITKGLQPENNDLLAFPDVVARELKKRLGFNVPVAAVGGPCIAGELAVRRQTGTVIVARDAALAEKFCRDFETEYYHPRASSDLMGVEVCAAFKNFFAIAVGWAKGQLAVMAEAQNKSLNSNAAAILFDQATRELMTLTLALGGTAESVWGMPGVGDLYVTCQAGRNSRLGNHLGRGMTYDAVKTGPMKDDTVEGAELGRAVAPTLRSMMTSGKLSSSALPLTAALLDSLVEDKPFTPQWALFHRSG
jgi:glycerol-3-phosphate dehydrogenase (NAD(P)+)